jgi:hypothetical protein
MYAYLIAAAIAATASWQIQNWRFAANERDRQEMQAKEQARKADRIDQAAVSHEHDKTRIETKYRTITKEIVREVAKPVYRNVCISPDGVRNINDLIMDSAAGEPEGAVSTTGTTSKRNR